MAKKLLPVEVVDRIVEVALEEDIGRGDITSEILIPCNLKGSAYIMVKEDGVVAGMEVAVRVFYKIDPSLQIETVTEDGARVKAGDIIMRITGSVRSLLKAERVALNFLQRLSGIATTTARYVEKVSDLGVEIADTRKTTPGLRILEKYAVRLGGGRNHRMDLGDAVLIKDNHFAALRSLGMSYREIVAKARESAPPDMKVEAEATSIEEALAAVEAGADIVMLDNMDIGEMKKAVRLIGGRVEIEASGNFRLENIRAAAETGVDFISVGALTHSYKSMDISMEIDVQSFRSA
ncbi:MAG: carboxylating nicotinate-nucleotide diphosphorylase [Dehalococcoidales bacterium]|jgi:nicotinate-nucleotide pyrophosphorylase (carboxylating)|nr:carboxylating nicotinate-nucleotide diphosphorylase [Dehalococcoidales bacterium]